MAEQSAHDLTAAERLLREYLAKAPTTAPDRNQAEARLESMTRKAQENVAPQPKPEAKPQPEVKPLPTHTEPPPPPPDVAGGAALVKPAGTDALGKLNATKPVERSDPRVMGWALVGGGAALAVGGLILYAATTSDISKYNAANGQKDDTGKIVGQSLAEAQSLRSSINARVGASVALAGVGVVATGVGTWWLLTTPQKTVTWVPGPALAGAGLALRF